MKDVAEYLRDKQRTGGVPKITAYNRIDGPGSSLDLREFQQSFWKLPTDLGQHLLSGDSDPGVKWSRQLPRTIGITINTGIEVAALPLNDGKIGVQSVDYGVEYVMEPDAIPYRRENWLARVVATFGLRGVLFKLRNLRPGMKSSGLGGSATATTAVCLLANSLAGKPFGLEQLVALASMVEQDMGVSITGTQEQANVVYGGVTDYIWFPWGVPGHMSGYGSAVRYELLPPTRYEELECRMALFHSGTERASMDINAVFRKRLQEQKGFALHRQKLEVAYRFREGIRKEHWQEVRGAIKQYREIRVALCSEYMSDKCWDIQGQCERLGGESFPLGAGGGGAVLVFASEPENLKTISQALSSVYRKIEFRILAQGHRFHNIED